LLATDSLDVLACPASPGLLKRTTTLLVFSMPMVTIEGAPGAGDPSVLARWARYRFRAC
jgi:hypothetical protein